MKRVECVENKYRLGLKHSPCVPNAIGMQKDYHLGNI